MNGNELPLMRTDIPGPKSEAWVERLARTECPAVTARRSRRAQSLGQDNDDPIVWEQAVGANVLDADGNRYVDLTSGFGVALVGHRNPHVVRAVHQQSQRLLHAMGDAWPDTKRIEFLDALNDYIPGNLEVSLLGLSGSDAVDAAIKTAILKTGKKGVLTFEGGYHGLSLGVLPLQGYKAAFTDPFRSIVNPNVYRLPFGCPMDDIKQLLRSQDIGLVLVEPILGRGGMLPPPSGWLQELSSVTRSLEALLAFDEIQSGMGRTGAPFAGLEEGVIPDLICIGKALGGGFPISACMGTREVMDSWGESTGEALHTQTFLGHPIGCAAALAVLELQTPMFFEQVNNASRCLRENLTAKGFSFRGRGLMMGVYTKRHTLELSRKLLQRGFITLPAGAQAEVLSLTPPACLTEEQIHAFVETLATLTEPTASQ